MLEIIDDKRRVLTGDLILEKYTFSYYSNKIIAPKVVFLPINDTEITKILNYANNNGFKVTVMGGNTGAVGSQHSIYENQIIIDLSLMNKILSFDEETLTLKVEPGVTLGDIRTYVERLGLFYPPDPGSKDATIGGMISTNAGGMRAIKYGTTRNYVKTIEVILPTGEKTELGSLTVKSSSGYDLKDLFIGSEGTLGIITKVNLKIIPMPKFKKSMILSFKNILDATKTVLKIIKEGFLPSALELFEKDTIQFSEKYLKKIFPSQKGEAFILLSLDSNNLSIIESEVNHLKQLFLKDTLEIISLKDNEEKAAWVLRDSILYALMEFTHYEMLDEVVPINKFADIVNYTKELQEKYQLKVLNFGHAGDGNIHTILLKENYDDKTWNNKKSLLIDDLYKKVKEFRGLISAEHGIGYLKKDAFLKYTDQNKVAIMRKIKNALDPNNILNPGKIF